MGRVEVITGVERRRRWSLDEKLALVAASYAPGAVVRDIARRADVRANQIYRWRRELRDVVPAPGFTPVVVVPAVSPLPPSASPDAMVEVLVNSEVLVRLPSSTPPDLASAVVSAALAGRMLTRGQP